MVRLEDIGRRRCRSDVSKCIANILLMGLFAGLGKNAKASGDEHGTKLCRLGIGLTAVSQCLLIASDIAALINNKKEDSETDLNE